MGRFVEGTDRGQSILFPECLEDWIGENNPVRVIDVFVDELHLGALGFDGVDPEATGRPSYHPSVLLKLYIYGYLNRVQSSRRLEREAGRNVEVMWLTGRLVPDHKTIGASAGARDRGWYRDGRHAGAGGAVAKHARPTDRSALCRPHWPARREREEMPGERAGPFGQCPGSTRHDSIVVAVAHVSEEQRLGVVVSSPHRERPRYSQNHDRGLGAQASDRPAAARAGGRCTGRHRFASGTMNGGC
jgi:hypothetical protein